MRHSYIDEYSSVNSLITRLDPRIKICTFFAFILFIILTPLESSHNLHTFGLYAIFIIILVLLSKIPIGFVLKRSLVVIPFAFMIAIFIPFFEKGHIIKEFSLGTLKIALTYEGLIIFLNCFIKSYLSILCIILLVGTTKFSNLLKAFEKLGGHKLIIMVIAFMYRYIFVVQDELMKMKQAREIRSLNKLRWFYTKVSANIVGVLFIRAYERAESVYLAMCSRGFDGKIRIINDFKLRLIDFFFFLAVFIVLVTIRLIAG